MDAREKFLLHVLIAGKGPISAACTKLFLQFQKIYIPVNLSTKVETFPFKDTYHESERINVLNLVFHSKFHFYRTQVSLGSDLWVLISLHPRLFADLTDVTLADEDSNSIPTNDVNEQSQAM